MSDKSMPAFPVQSVYIEDEPTNSRGMTLRQWYAGLAMQGMFANPEDIHRADEETYEEYVAEIARCAHQMADAMLKAGEAK